MENIRLKSKSEIRAAWWKRFSEKFISRILFSTISFSCLVIALMLGRWSEELSLIEALSHPVPYIIGILAFCFGNLIWNIEGSKHLYCVKCGKSQTDNKKKICECGEKLYSIKYVTWD